MLPAFRAHVRPVALVEEGTQVVIGHEHHVPAAASVPAVGSTARHELLAPKAHATVASRARRHADLGFVDEVALVCHWLGPRRKGS
jgi:hypothetical protein